ncbi:hypothetical protein RDI58_015080 [Solanum bulbocastanum]|uniref:Aminotransferase-like plant mobile domain-containing protein n=1 Tax=Solanum bulbocastanum TaxID=147425 RepID=A0AAN8TG88_SOLBU
MAGNIPYQLDPGPLESSVLTEQITHRSQDIWDGSVNMILNTRRCDGKFWDLVKKYPIPPRVLEVIQLSGLYGVYRTGETTITLQDVEVLYGLSVNGHLVLDFNHNSLKVSARNEHMLGQPQLPNIATQDMVNQKARCFMFWIIVGMMMADTSSSFLKLMYLHMLEDVNAIWPYSWGSAILACLYHFLLEICDAMTNLEDSNIEIEGNDLDDSNNEVDGNDPENASGGGEPSVKKKRIIFPKLCGIGSHHLNQHGIKKTTKCNKDTVATKRRSKE